MSRGDNPIQTSDEDTLGRAAVARSFARQVLTLDASQGVVVGVLGPWGSGKTSFFNLARPQFGKAGVPILDFNPWMFSGAQQLVESFFLEIAAQLRIRHGLAEVGKDLADYGEMFSGLGWLPILGTWIERTRAITGIAGDISKRRREGVGTRRDRIQKALARLDKPILVFLDDVDRLSTDEIRDMFKLVRLTASFPNLIYVVAFDRHRVEQALSDQGIPGRDYLEKILQVAIDLPEVPDQVLAREVGAALAEGLAKVEHRGPFDEAAWPDIFSDIVRPLIRNMRDVRRYVSAAVATVSALDGQAALADVLALEAIRIFLPDVFSKLHAALRALTTTSDDACGERRESLELKRQATGLVEAGAAKADVVRAMIKRLFPAAERHIEGSHFGQGRKTTWLKDRRVAHEEILRLYLERVVGVGLRSFQMAEQAWPYFADQEELDRYLRSLDRNTLEDVIPYLEGYEDQFRAEHVVPAATVLLNILDEIPARERHMLEFGSVMAVGRVTYRLLRSLKNPTTTEAAIRQILPQLKSLSSKLELISQVGHQKDIGLKLVSETAAEELETHWRAEVRRASVADLVKEREILRILWLTKSQAKDGEEALEIQNSPEFTRALLRSARGDQLRQTLGSRSVQRFPSLDWNALIAVYGEEDVLRQRIESLRAAKLGGDDDLLELCDKYLGGWRPTPGGPD
ncbi:MAG: KAP family P-loop NTPase fold protein [Candidatus Acidiferrales bacterium]